MSSAWSSHALSESRGGLYVARILRLYQVRVWKRQLAMGVSLYNVHVCEISCMCMYLDFHVHVHVYV